MVFDKASNVLQSIVLFFIGILTPIMFIVIGNGLLSNTLTFMGTGSRFFGALFLVIGVIAIVFVIISAIVSLLKAIID